jgi:hypothetical protein
MTRRISALAAGHLLLLAVASIASAQENEEQKRALDEIRKLAPDHIKKLGDLWLFNIGDGGAVLGVTLTFSTRLSDDDLALLQSFKKLRKLDLDYTKAKKRGRQRKGVGSLFIFSRVRQGWLDLQPAQTASILCAPWKAAQTTVGVGWFDRD